MVFNPVSFVLEYANWIIKKYTELQKNQDDNIFRIADIKKNSLGQIKIVVQVIGKSTVFECTPKEIAADTHMLEGFSRANVRTITYFACEELKEPAYTISSQEFCMESNRATFKLKKRGHEKTLCKTAAEISTDKDLIKKMSQEDICSISYLAGYEHASNK
jgi:hypothetical protein